MKKFAKAEGGCIYFGFKEGITREEFSKAIEESKTDKDAMERLLVKREVEIGDVVLVPAKAVHTIGAGCLILEIQEPTDFTIQPEYWCGETALTHKDMYIGLDKETAIDCFDFDPIVNVKTVPVCIESNNNIKIEELIGLKQTNNFGINRITLTEGEFTPDKGAGIYVVTEGCGEITGKDFSRKLVKGDYFLFPDIARGNYKIKGNIEVVECFSY